MAVSGGAGGCVFGHCFFKGVGGDVPAIGQCAGEFLKGGCFDDFAACFADVFDAVVVRGGPLGECVLVVADVLVKDEYGGGLGLLDEGVAGDFVA